MLQVSPDRFRLQIQAMAAAGFEFLTVSRFLEESGGLEPRPGVAVVTFDDGLRNNLTTALPILREVGAPATVYVTTDWLGGSSPWIAPRGGAEILTPSDVRALAKEGWEIGTHTLSHADLSALDYDSCAREIGGSCDAVREITGAGVLTLAYPFGRYHAAALAAARDSGLRGAVTTGSGRWDAYELTRAMVGPIDPLPLVLLKLTDRYEPFLRRSPFAALREASKRARSGVSEVVVDANSEHRR